MDAAFGVALLCTLASAVACGSWLEQARTGTVFPRRGSQLLAGWAGLAFLTRVIVQVDHSLSPASATLLYLVGGFAAVVGVVAAAPGIVLAGSLGPAIAEAALIGSSVVAVGWGGFGPVVPPSVVIVPLVLLIIACTVVAVLVRAVVTAPPLVIDTRYRQKVVTAVAGAAAFAVGDVVAVMVVVGAAVPVAAQDVAALVGYLCAAAVPWVGQVPPRRGARPSFFLRTLPYTALSAAVLAQGVAALRGALGVVTLSLGALVVVCLMALQGLALRENARLSTDLEYSRARLAALVENSGDVILGLDPSGRVVAANAAATTLLHRAPDILVGQDVAELAVLPERSHVRATVLGVANGRITSARIELTLAAPATGTAELRLRGVPGGAVANLSDVTESVELRTRLARMARYDPMTGLANRAHLQDELGRWLDDGHVLSVLYLDLDGFKAVNDRFGHVAGDGVLTDVAGRLIGAAGSMPGARSVVARMGGDEFVIALLDVPLAQALGCAETVLNALRPTFSVADRAVRIGASIGAAGTGDGASGRMGLRGADDILHRADIAMYAAKESGKAGLAQVIAWDVALEERAMRRVDIAIGLRRALDTGRLALAYQPIVRLSDGVIVAVEALIRLPRSADEDPDQPDPPGSLTGLADVVSPAELVEVAEGTGEIDELGRWVLAEATHQASLWQTMGLDVRVNVNMSVRQLSDEGFVEAVRAALAAARLAPDRLVVEITEGQLLGEGHRANDTVRRLRADGVQLAIDDFGSGYSSLSYLRRMPVRTVKIDQTLLDGVGSDPRATTLVRAVIGAARGLGLLVVCEGIESLAMARCLRDLGAWAGQGFALYGAMTSSALLDVLESPPLALTESTGGAGAVATPANASSRAGRGASGQAAGSAVGAVGAVGAAGSRRAGASARDRGYAVSHHETGSSHD